MSPLDVNQFDEISIGLATAQNIRSWSSGEVKKPETINYRTLRPEKDGLFCEKIFGPQKAWECACGKYKRVRFKGIVCERCGVEVTSDKVRRERMGHIALSAPVVHIWYLRGTRSWLAYLLMGTAPKEELKAKQLEKVIYFAAHMVTYVDVDRRHAELAELRVGLNEEILEIAEREVKALDNKLKEIEARAVKLEAEGAKESELRALQRGTEKELDGVRSRFAEERELAKQAFDTFEGLHSRQIIEDEVLYREMDFRYGEYFEGGMGADAILQLIDRMNLDDEEKVMREMIDAKDGRKPLSAQRHAKFLKRLAIVQSFNRRDDHGHRLNDPRAMILEAVPVIPPDLRPMVQLDGGRFATSDLNDLYRRVINRNNRLKRLLDLGAPDIIVNNEKRMLQEAVDALFDNGRRGRPVAGQSGRPLKSLSDMLKGKQGRFRQNLLGKRVDYSGRSVIVVGPTLKLHQCGLPKMMALELFKPFIMKRLIETQMAQNIKSAKRMVERRKAVVWDVLEEVIREHPVLLNRAPTLHRLGIQAFEPILVDGKAIQIHPLVCKAFNADFDGDQMAVHVPLSAESQAEARILMLSTNNIFTPATGRPITEPAQDMVFGAYYLTLPCDEVVEHPKNYRHVYSIENAVSDKLIGLRSAIEIRPLEGSSLDARLEAAGIEVSGAGRSLVTTPGRVLFNEALPFGFRYVNEVIGKNAVPIGTIVEEISASYSRQEVAESLDAIKSLGFRFATRSGLTISIDDIVTTPEKAAILNKYEEQAAKVETNYRRGVIVDDERRQQEIEIWTNANKEVGDATDRAMNAISDNPIRMMVDSGARGNSQQIRQIAAMKGLVSNPRGEMIPRPIKSSFREGLSVLEYFISTHGTRKGLGDTALRTADSGYLTRRLVDVAQELIVKEFDCNTSRGMWIEHVAPDTRAVRSHLETKLWGRVSAEDVTLADGSLIPRGTMLLMDDVERLRDDASVERVRVRTTLTCDAIQGVCAACYGLSLATHQLVELGEAVGVIAAQSIGEPGTQLTMRTFHSGGVSESDITHGLPRVVELFEARTPKGAAAVAEFSGVVRVELVGRERKVTMVGDEGQLQEESISIARHLLIEDGQEVEVGTPLHDGPLDPKLMMKFRGTRETQQYLTEEVQNVYRDQGVSIHDKHIELIVRQMTRRVQIVDAGQSTWLPGALIDVKLFNDTNDELEASGSEAADGRAQLMGITKASLATDSWLSAASFQETTRVLTEAAIEGKRDYLVGLKENIIIGKLIPAGSGLEYYNKRELRLDMPDAELLPAWAQVSDDDLDLASLLGELSSDDSFSADLSAFQNIGTATYDESALPENDADNPEDQLGGQAL
ncbi:MAG TPA: DNA-directed RNA polymerase subunit beta' [Acidimicrobiales bacterium]|nr:DNA-directed RNA polymerase subunit beta' [Acidimicrobiales bacterium]